MTTAADPSDGRESGDDAPSRPQAAPGLRAALRAARIEEAERGRALADLHGVDLARLEILRDRLAPMAAELPADADLFDFAVAPSPRPRLFIDMIGFVEMAADRRRYRLIQDTRDGRLVLHEGEGLGGTVEAVTAYVARRLVEREKMLASAAAPQRAPAARAADTGAASIPGWGSRLARLVLEYLGVAALVVLLWVLGHALFQWATRP